jgi:hypothetical protein
MGQPGQWRKGKESGDQSGRPDWGGTLRYTTAVETAGSWELLGGRRRGRWAAGPSGSQLGLMVGRASSRHFLNRHKVGIGC